MSKNKNLGVNLSSYFSSEHLWKCLHIQLDHQGGVNDETCELTFVSSSPVFVQNV